MPSEGYRDKKNRKSVGEEDDGSTGKDHAADFFHLSSSCVVNLLLKYSLPPEELDVFDTVESVFNE